MATLLSEAAWLCRLGGTKHNLQWEASHVDRAHGQLTWHFRLCGSSALLHCTRSMRRCLCTAGFGKGRPQSAVGHWRQRTRECAPRRAAWPTVPAVATVGIQSDDEIEAEAEIEEGTYTTEERLVNNEVTLQISKADFTVSSVLTKIRNKKLNLRPLYQREYVWDKRTASKLIESLLLNIPVPTMFFHERERGKLEVVDGKQRLTSIWSFVENGKFPDGTDFALTGLEVYHNLNGCTYKDLNEDLQESLQDYALNVHTISRHSDQNIVFEVFERLNMGSVQLNEQELRHAIYQGPYNLLLEKLANGNLMKAAMRSEEPHKRMRDRELILRFFAMRRNGIEGFCAGPQKLRVSIKAWLNNEMRSNLDISEHEALVMQAEFERALGLCLITLNKQAFRICRPRGSNGEPSWDGELNVALWDTLMYGFCQWRDDPAILAAASQLQAAYQDMMTQDPTFTSQNLISTQKALKYRWQKWSERLEAVLGPPDRIDGSSN